MILEMAASLFMFIYYLGLDGGTIRHCQDGATMAAAGIFMDGSNAAAESDRPSRYVLGQCLDQVLPV